MTQEQKRIKLAEAFGMTGWEEARALPDFFNDLDAVHELEKALTYEQQCFYCDILKMVVGGPAYMPAVRASAAQRCEALGKTLNLW